MLGNTDYKLNELEKQSTKQRDDIEAMITQLGVLKKRIDALASENESLHLRLETVEQMIDEL